MSATVVALWWRMVSCGETKQWHQKCGSVVAPGPGATKASHTTGLVSIAMVQFCVVQYGAVQCNVMQRSSVVNCTTARCCAVMCCAVLCFVVQRSAVKFYVLRCGVRQ